MISNLILRFFQKTQITQRLQGTKKNFSLVNFTFKKWIFCTMSTVNLFPAWLFIFFIYTCNSSIVLANTDELQNIESNTISKPNAIDNSSNVVNKIVVVGNARIATSTILSYMELNSKHSNSKILNSPILNREIAISNNDKISNFTYNDTLISQGIHKLYNTGFFSDINTSYANNVLTIKVTESPTIHQIGFEGNKKINDQDLIKVLLLKQGSSFSSILLQKDTNTILDFYQKRGLFATLIEPKLVKLPDNRISIVFKIKESNKSKIEKIQFLGNESYKPQELMSAILSKESAWYRLFSSVDFYDSDKTKIDEEMLKNFYYDRGYLDFNIQETQKEISPQKGSFLVTFVINEGNQYRLNEATVTSSIDKINTDDLLKKNFHIVKNEVLSYSKLTDAAEEMKDSLRKQGYAFVEVNFNIERGENNIANIKFNISESLKVYINRINIVNNLRTLDRVIRREMRVIEGDAYNFDLIDRSKQRIANTGYFSDVEINPVSTNIPDKIDLNVKVKEISTGSCSFNMGYNTEAGALGGISVSENNLLGTGRIANLTLQKAQRSSNISLGFTEPYFLNMNMFAGIDLFYRQTSYKQNTKNKANIDQEKDKKDKDAKLIKKDESNQYNSKNVGASFKVGYELSEYWSHIVRYNIRSEKYDNISDNTSDFLKAQGKSNIVSSISHSLTYDKRNSSIRPTSGYIAQLSQEFAGLGGTAHYIQNELIGSFYQPLYKKDIILKITGRAGIISGKNIRIIDNFFIGDDYIRGFNNQGIGPRDIKTLDSLGGKNYYAGTAEVNFPLGLPKEIDIMGAAFIDTASLFNIDIPKNTPYKLNKTMFYNDHSFRVSYGAGVIWYSPMGTIRIDYGIPTKKKNYDKVNNFRINFGSSF